VITLGVVGALPLDEVRGPRGVEAALMVVIATAAAVTSIPVISRIFFDLKILHTRFASLILGTAMLEDIVLFGALAVATALADGSDAGLAVELTTQISVTVIFLVIGLVVAPRFLARVQARFQELEGNAPSRTGRLAYALALMVGYSATAELLGVNVVFGAFLAGFGLVGGFGGAYRERFAGTLATISRIAFATLIPAYFALVGARLELGAGFSLALLLAFLVGSSILRFTAVAIASRMAGVKSADAVNIGVAMNARGGPGIVLATVAYEAGIIAPSLFTALVVTAIVTSQLASWWLGRAIRDRGELLGEPVVSVEDGSTAQAPAGSRAPA